MPANFMGGTRRATAVATRVSQALPKHNFWESRHVKNKA
jgi:hypothetical protein